MQRANELPAGFYTYSISGNDYQGADLPTGEYYRYTSVAIFKRNDISINVVLLGAFTEPIATNFYSSAGWAGWQKYVRTSDISRLEDILSMDFGSYNNITNMTFDKVVFDILKNKLPTSNDTNTIIGRFQYSGWYRMIIQTYTNNRYNSAIVFGYGVPHPIFYRTSNGSIARFDMNGTLTNISSA